jgi:hypothetical protein
MLLFQSSAYVEYLSNMLPSDQEIFTAEGCKIFSNAEEYIIAFPQ